MTPNKQLQLCKASADPTANRPEILRELAELLDVSANAGRLPVAALVIAEAGQAMRLEVLHARQIATDMLAQAVHHDQSGSRRARNVLQAD